MSKTWTVEIIETLSLKVDIEADSKEEAEKMVESRWKDSEYILDADSFAGVEFRVNPKLRDLER